MNQQYDLNRFRVYWLGQTHHTMVFGYKIPGATLLRSVVEMQSTPEHLERFVALIDEGERQQWQQILLLEQGVELLLPMPFAREIRQTLLDHLQQWKAGTLKPYEDTLGHLPFSDS